MMCWLPEEMIFFIINKLNWNDFPEVVEAKRRTRWRLMGARQSTTSPTARQRHATPSKTHEDESISMARGNEGAAVAQRPSFFSRVARRMRLLSRRRSSEQIPSEQDQTPPPQEIASDLTVANSLGDIRDVLRVVPPSASEGKRRLVGQRKWTSFATPCRRHPEGEVAAAGATAFGSIG